MASMRNGASTSPRRLARGGIAAGALAWLAGGFWPRALDDAYITAAYAVELLQSGALRWTGGDRLEGYSNFSWVLLQALALAGGLDPILVSKATSLASGLLLVLLVNHVAPLDRRGDLAVAALVSWVPLAYWSGMAMESQLAALLAAAGWWALLTGSSGLGMGLLAGLAFTRPEGWVWLALGALLVIRHGRPKPRVILASASALLLVLAYHLWRIDYFGDVLSAPARLKVRPGAFGVAQLLVESLSAAGVLLALWSGWRLRSEQRLFVLAPILLGALSLLGMNGDWMGPGRLLMPGVMATALGWMALGEVRKDGRWARVAVAAVLLTFLFEPRFLSPPALRPLLPRYHRGLETPLTDTVRYIVERAPADAVVQSADIGIQGHIPRVHLLDARGLTTRLFLEARGSGDWSGVRGLYDDPERRPVLVQVVTMRPAWLVEAGLVPLDPLPGFDPWLQPVAGATRHYPLREDVYFSEMSWRGVARFHRSRNDDAPAEIQRERWHGLAERFPAHPWLRARSEALSR